jgi:tRNA dimethylallyltransferase
MPTIPNDDQACDDDPEPEVDAPSWHAIEEPHENELLVVVGPTASGKTELAIRLAEIFDGEIIGADSVQIYRAFDIGSGKPTDEERARAPHHLVSIADPLEAFDAKTFAELADQTIADVRARGRVPVVCGGTFLWVKALVWGLAPAPPADKAIRARHAAIAEAQGRAALHAQLADVDPESAARLAPNDLVRVSRALEVFELSGKRQSEWFAAHGFRGERHRARFVGIARPRDELEQRIRTRARVWIEHGWIEEVQGLVARGYGEARAMASVGYRQVRDYLEGTLAREALEDAVVRATRIFARRQRTWLRDQPVGWYAL